MKVVVLVLNGGEVKDDILGVSYSVPASEKVVDVTAEPTQVAPEASC